MPIDNPNPKPELAPLPVPPGYTPPAEGINKQVKAELNMWLAGATSIVSQVQYAQPQDSPVRAEMDVLLQMLHGAIRVVKR